MSRALMIVIAIVFAVGAADARPRKKKRKSARRAVPVIKVAPEPAARTKPRLSTLLPEPAEYVEPALLGEPVPPRPVIVARAAPSTSVERTQPLLELRLDDGPVMRRLRYRDDWQNDGDNVRDYDLTANALALHILVRPYRNLELVATGELLTRVIGSAGPDAELHATSSSELRVGARYTVTRGRLRAGLELEAGQHRFAIADEMSARGELVPDTRYRFVRGGATAQLAITGTLRVASSIAYRALVDSGELDDAMWFPHASGGGVDAAVGLELQLHPRLHGYLRGQVRRYFFALHPEPGDPLIVGGALDQYLSIAAGLAVAVL